MFSHYSAKICIIPDFDSRRLISALSSSGKLQNKNKQQHFRASKSNSNLGGRHVWCGKEKPTVWEHTGLYAQGGGQLNEGKVRLVRIITRGGKPQQQKGIIARKQNSAKCTGNKPLNQFFTTQEVTYKNKNHEGFISHTKKNIYLSVCLFLCPLCCTHLKISS